MDIVGLFDGEKVGLGVVGAKLGLDEIVGVIEGEELGVVVDGAMIDGL